jgi:hypothetical protein
MWFEAIHRVAEVDWPDTDMSHVDGLLISGRVGYVTEQVCDGVLSLWFDLSSAHWTSAISQKS